MKKTKKWLKIVCAAIFILALGTTTLTNGTYASASQGKVEKAATDKAELKKYLDNLQSTLPNQMISFATSQGNLAEQFLTAVSMNTSMIQTGTQVSIEKLSSENGKISLNMLRFVDNLQTVNQKISTIAKTYTENQALKPPVPTPIPKPPTPSISHDFSSTSGGGSDITSPLIASVESVKNGWVRVTLSRATYLTQENFNIICTGGGRDMTIRSVSSADNKTYDLYTAYYNDDTYRLYITQNNRVTGEKDFISHYDCAELTNQLVTRTSNTTATLVYNSDSMGTLYYVVQKNASSHNFLAEPKASNANGSTISGTSAILSRSFLSGTTAWTANKPPVSGTGAILPSKLWNGIEPPTADELIQLGTPAAMTSANNNPTEITGLEAGVAYTLYYVAKDSWDRVTTVQSLAISSNAVQDTSDIHIINASAFDLRPAELTGIHNKFTLELSAATAQPLKLENFSIICPSDGRITLGSVSSIDNKTYEIFVAAGYVIKDNNTFTATITFADGNTATKNFYVDLSAPEVLTSGLSFNYISKDTVEISFSSNEPGKLYYEVSPEIDSDSDISWKNPAYLFANSTGTVQVKHITAGPNNPITISGLTGKNNMYIRYATEDHNENRSVNYWYKKIPAYVAPPVQPPAPPVQNVLKITNVKVNDSEMIITFNQAVNFWAIESDKYSVTNVNLGKVLWISESLSSTQISLSTPDPSFVLNSGSHVLTVVVNIDGRAKTLTYNFNS